MRYWLRRVLCALGLAPVEMPTEEDIAWFLACVREAKNKAPECFTGGNVHDGYLYSSVYITSDWLDYLAGRR